MRFRDKNTVGRTREKLAAMLEAALKETEIGRQFAFTVDPTDLHSAQGRYRSDWRQDCYRWEGWGYTATEHSKRGYNVSFHSYATMTDCVRYGIKLSKDPKHAGQFDVYSKKDIDP